MRRPDLLAQGDDALNDGNDGHAGIFAKGPCRRGFVAAYTVRTCAADAGTVG